ncbi:MAG: peptide deformylase [Elusimicrobia bacterium]|nr:peptide deformylase [Elusimicrobiota bacterium]
MPILRICKHGETVLKKTCQPVDYEALKPELPAILKQMWATMYAANGVGLAAPQVGLDLRLSIIDVRPGGKHQRLVLINPEILSSRGQILEEEGCLSVPGVYAKLQRASAVRVRALDARGLPCEMAGEGLLARAFQHEIDHLDGKLFIDRLDFVHKLKVMSIIKDLKKNWS